MGEPGVAVGPWGADRTGRSVCIITQNESFGGMEVHTLALIGALLERGYTIELIENRYRGYDPVIQRNGWQDRVRIIHTDLPGILYGERSDRAGWRRQFQELASRTLVFPKGNYNFGQFGFLRECRRAFESIVFIEHLEPHERPSTRQRHFGVVPGLGLWWHKRKYLSRAGSTTADVIVAVSNRVRDRLVADIGYPTAKLRVVRNGVAWRTLQRDVARGAGFRERFGVPGDAIVFGMLTRLSPEKAIDVAIRAAALLASRAAGRAFRLMIAGEGAELDRLRALAADLGVSEIVRFVGFVVDPRDVLSGYDAIVFSSRVEGLPLGLLEGMAAGCVPVVTRISGMPEAVSSDVGWVVPPDNPEELAAAMHAVMALDALQLSALREAAAARIRDEFDADATTGTLVTLCEGVARGAVRSGR